MHHPSVPGPWSRWAVTKARRALMSTSPHVSLVSHAVAMTRSGRSEFGTRPEPTSSGWSGGCATVTAKFGGSFVVGSSYPRRRCSRRVPRPGGRWHPVRATGPHVVGPWTSPGGSAPSRFLGGGVHQGLPPTGYGGSHGRCEASSRRFQNSPAGWRPVSTVRRCEEDARSRDAPGGRRSGGRA